MVVHDVYAGVGLVGIRLKAGDEPVGVNCFEFRDYVAANSGQFKASHGSDWAGPLVAAFFGVPYSAEEWSEGRASFIMEIMFDEVNRLKKGAAGSGTPA